MMRPPRLAALLAGAIILLATSSVHAQVACDFWVANGGSGAGLTQSAPTTFAGLWAKGQAALQGKTACLLDGTYTGAANVIQPPAGLSGTASARITVRAVNDGAVTIDGEHIRAPLYLIGNQFYTFEGFNAKRGQSVVLGINNVSDNNIFRRIVAWDAHIAINTHVVIICDSQNTLLEDVALFGTGHTMITNYSSGGNNCVGGGTNHPSTGTVMRRVWGRFEGTITQGFATTFQIGYDSGPAQTCENCIATYSAESMPQEYDMTNASGVVVGPHFTSYTPAFPAGVLQMENNGSGPTGSLAKIYGSLVYMKPDTPGTSDPNWLLRAQNAQNVDIRHTLVVTPSTHNKYSQIVGMRLDGPSGGSSTGTLTRSTSIRSPGSGAVDLGGDFFGSNWTLSGFASATTPGGLSQDPWTSSSSGANLCYRWIEGGSAPSTTPLWPWPMNDRIKAATAAAGRYGDGVNTLNGVSVCPNCVGGRAARLTTDVQADIESILGAIPSQCTTAVVPPSPPFPEASGFPSTPLIDTFTGTGALSSLWTTPFYGNGFTRSGDAAISSDGAFGLSAYNTVFSGSQEVYATLKTLPLEGGSWAILGFLTQDANNRYAIGVSRIAGGNNDQVYLTKLVNGNYTQLALINLDGDVQAGDKFGVRAMNQGGGLPTLITAYWYRVATGRWYELGVFQDLAYSSGKLVMGGGSSMAWDDFGGGAVGATLIVAPLSLSVTTTVGASPQQSAITITDAAATGTMAWTASAGGSAWLSVSPTSGTGDTVGSVTLNPSPGGTPLAAGTYNGNITVTATGATGSPATIPVTFTITAGTAPGTTQGGRIR